MVNNNPPCRSTSNDSSGVTLRSRINGLKSFVPFNCRRSNAEMAKQFRLILTNSPDLSRCLIVATCASAVPTRCTPQPLRFNFNVGPLIFWWKYAARRSRDGQKCPRSVKSEAGHSCPALHQKKTAETAVLRRTVPPACLMDRQTTWPAKDIGDYWQLF